MSVAGDVANRTKHTLDRVEAVVDLLDQERLPCSVRRALWLRSIGLLPVSPRRIRLR